MISAIQNCSKGQQRLFSLALCKVQNFCLWTNPNFYLLIGCKVKSYLAKAKNFGLWAFMKAKRPIKAKKRNDLELSNSARNPIKFFSQNKRAKKLSENYA